MRHLKAHRKLGRTSEHRHSMLRNLATSLINSREERIVTTLPKAKELRPFVERAITLSRKARSLSDNGSDMQALHLRRQAAGFFHAGNMAVKEVTGKRGQLRPERTAGVAALRRLFTELGDRYKDRPGGYTRILNWAIATATPPSSQSLSWSTIVVKSRLRKPRRSGRPQRRRRGKAAARKQKKAIQRRAKLHLKPARSKEFSRNGKGAK